MARSRQRTIVGGALVVVLTLALPVVASAAGLTAAGNRRAAIADVEERLVAFPLPPGAIASKGRPPGVDPELNSPPLEPETPNLIDHHAWWTAPGAPQENLDWFRANLPAGTHVFLSGAAGSHLPVPKLREPTTSDRGSSDDQATSDEYLFIEIVWQPLAERMSERAMIAAATAIPGGGTALRLDSQAIWIEPHPASERIPAAARLLEVEWKGPRGRSAAVVTRKAGFIDKVAAAIDRLPIGQPGLSTGFFCPDEPFRSVTLRFRTRRNGRLLAEAVQELPDDGCHGGLELTVHRKGQPVLLESKPVLELVRRLRAGPTAAPSS